MRPLRPMEGAPGGFPLATRWERDCGVPLSVGCFVLKEHRGATGWIANEAGRNFHEDEKAI